MVSIDQTFQDESLYKQLSKTRTQPHTTTVARQGLASCIQYVWTSQTQVRFVHCTAYKYCCGLYVLLVVHAAFDSSYYSISYLRICVLLDGTILRERAVGILVESWCTNSRGRTWRCSRGRGWVGDSRSWDRRWGRRIGRRKWRRWRSRGFRGLCFDLHTHLRNPRLRHAIPYACALLLAVLQMKCRILCWRLGGRRFYPHTHGRPLSLSFHHFDSTPLLHCSALFLKGCGNYMNGSKQVNQADIFSTHSAS